MSLKEGGKCPQRANVLVFRSSFRLHCEFHTINDTPSSPRVSRGSRRPVLLPLASIRRESVSAAVQKVCKRNINGGGKKARVSHCDNKPERSARFQKSSANRQQPGMEEGDAGGTGTNRNMI